MNRLAAKIAAKNKQIHFYKIISYMHEMNFYFRIDTFSIRIEYIIVPIAANLCKFMLPLLANRCQLMPIIANDVATTI